MKFTFIIIFFINLSENQIIKNILETYPEGTSEIVIFDLESISNAGAGDITRGIFNASKIHKFAVVANNKIDLYTDKEISNLKPSLNNLLNSTKGIFDDYKGIKIGVLGISRTRGTKPITLAIEFNREQKGNGYAIFPFFSGDYDYSLLKIVGVTYRGFEKLDDGRFIVKFDIDIKRHLNSGRVFGYKKGGMCSMFFRERGDINAVKASIKETLKNMVSYTEGKALDFLTKKIDASLFKPLFFRYEDGRKQMEPHGEIAPFGFIFRAIKEYGIKGSHTYIEKMKSFQENGLYSWNRGTPKTPADTCLALEAVDTPPSENFIKKFWISGRGLSAGRLCSEENTPPLGARFWCEPDLPFSACIGYFLPDPSPLKTDIIRIIKNSLPSSEFSIFIANPYLARYYIARLIKKDTQSCGYLVSKTLGEQNEDGSWGSYDTVISTALAILTLNECDYYGQEIGIGLSYLFHNQNQDGGFQNSTIFYASFMAGRKGEGDEWKAGNKYFKVDTFREIDGAITTSLVLLALKSKYTFDYVGKKSNISASRYKNQKDFITTQLEYFSKTYSGIKIPERTGEKRWW